MKTLNLISGRWPMIDVLINWSEIFLKFPKRFLGPNFRTERVMEKNLLIFSKCVFLIKGTLKRIGVGGILKSIFLYFFIGPDI